MDTKEKAATAIGGDKSQSVLSEPERLKGSRSGEISGQHRTEVRNL